MASQQSPSQIITGLVLTLAALSVGYNLGARTRPLPPLVPAALPPQPPLPATVAKEDAPGTAPVVEDDDESSDDDEDVADGELGAVKAGWTEPCKLVLIVRTDLNMSSGKIAAQCSHATLACYKALSAKNPSLVRHWERTGQAKIALKASSEDQLLELEAIAKSLNLCARAIHDAGRTQVAAGSRTVLGIGPGPVELINRVTGKLRLL